LKYQYFALNQSGPAWEAVNRARNFAAYVPGELPNPTLELLILLPQAG
jgi:type VI secretion system protein ImpJ